MAVAKIDDTTFIREWNAARLAGLKPANTISRKYGIHGRNVRLRQLAIEGRFQCDINEIELPPDFEPEQYPGRLVTDFNDGIVFIGSDFHYWPGTSSVIHRAIVKFAKEMQPSIFVLNGDVMDCATVSRHPPIGWEGRPSVAQEIEVCQDRLHEISSVLPMHARRVWTLGNHDKRFETFIAAKAPELAKVKGIHLHDHFPDWERAWTFWINDRPSGAVIQHRFKGGVYAPKNNTIYAGRTMVTGHLHAAGIYDHTDLNGTRWGMDTGCVADPYHRAFDYLEGAPRNWRAAFGLLTFIGGRLLCPELVRAIDPTHVDFRGQVIEV